MSKELIFAAAGNAGGGAEFLYDDNFEDYLISEVTVNVDDVFTSPTDTDQDPIILTPQSQFKNPTTGYIKQRSQVGSYVRFDSNKMFLSFEDEISNTDVSAVIEIDFDSGSYTTLINNSDWNNQAPNNLRYIEGGDYIWMSRGAGNAALGYNLSTNSTFTFTPPATASNGNKSRFQDPTLESLHEGCYTTHGTSYDLWTFQKSSTGYLTENISTYFNSSVGVSFRLWTPIYFDDDYVFWFDNERTGYSTKGSTNSQPLSGYNILASSTGVANNASNGDTWAFSDTSTYCDIWNNTYVYNTNPADSNYRLYRRLYVNAGTPTFTSWEDPLSSLRPAASGSYAQFSDIYSAGTTDYQVANIYVYDGATSTGVTALYKMTDTTTFDGPYTYPDLTGWIIRYIDAKTIWAYQIVDDKTFKVRLYRTA